MESVISNAVTSWMPRVIQKARKVDLIDMVLFGALVDVRAIVSE